jgi:hypothetical protein
MRWGRFRKSNIKCSVGGEVGYLSSNFNKPGGLNIYIIGLGKKL